MGNFTPRDAPAFRRQIIDLCRRGGSLNELAKAFGCTNWWIRQWVKQLDRDTCSGDGGLSSLEREELTRLRR